MSLGGAAATALAGWLLGWMEWPGVYLVLALPGVLWAAWFWTWFRDLPQQHPGVNAAELAVIRGGIRRPEGAAPCDDPGPDGPGSDGIGSDGIGSDGPGLDGPRSPAEPTPWRTMMSRRDLWLMCAQQFFRAAGYIFYPTWFPTYLKETRHVSEQDAGYLTSLPLLAVVVGNLLGGYAVDWIWHRTGSRRLSRRGVALPCLLACAGFCLVAGQATSAQSAVWLMAAGSFCFGIGSPASYAITIDKGGRHVTAVFSTMNMAGNIGATVCPTVVTWFVAWTGNWDSVLMLFAGMYLAAAACWAALDAEGSLFDKRPA
jgi:nitrate/nitrite transporter NarK